MVVNSRAATVAALALIWIVLLDFPSLACGAKYTTCTLLYGGVNDLGWTYSANIGRIAAHQELISRYPQHEFVSHSFPNTFARTQTRELIDGLWREIQEKQCNVLFMLGCCYLDNFTLPLDPRSLSWIEDRADRYPNMTFIILWGDSNALFSTKRSNLVFFNSDYLSGYFVAGAAAAAQATTCVAIIAPFTWERSSHDAVTGFNLGVYRQKPDLKVHVVEMRSFTNPSGERLIARVLGEQMGCEVVARYSDSRDMDLFVQRSLPGVMSIGAHADLQQVVGDAVLASVFVDWKLILLHNMERLIETGSVQRGVPQVYGAAEGILKLSGVSPRANPGVAAAAANAVAYLQQVGNNLLCGPPLPTTAPGLFTNFTYPPNSTCRNVTLRLPGFGLTPNAVFHGFFTPPTNCPNGSAAYYNTSGPTLRINCLVCPPNTFAISGDLDCTPCADGLVSLGNASSCFAKPAEVSQAERVGAPVGGTLGSVVIALFAVFLFVRSYRKKQFPQEGALYCLMTSRIGGDPVSEATVDRVNKMKSEVLLNKQTLYRAGTSDAFTTLYVSTSLDECLSAAIDMQSNVASVSWANGSRGAPTPIGYTLHVATDYRVDVTALGDVRYGGPDVKRIEEISKVHREYNVLIMSDAFQQAMNDDPNWSDVTKLSLREMSWRDAASSRLGRDTEDVDGFAVTPATDNHPRSVWFHYPNDNYKTAPARDTVDRLVVRTFTDWCRQVGSEVTAITFNSAFSVFLADLNHGTQKAVCRELSTALGIKGSDPRAIINEFNERYIGLVWNVDDKSQPNPLGLTPMPSAAISLALPMHAPATQGDQRSSVSADKTDSLSQIDTS